MMSWGAFRRQLGPKRVPRWSKLDSKWPSGDHLGRPVNDFWESWERSLQKSRKAKNKRQYNVLALFSWSGVSGWSLLVAMLSDVGHNFGDFTDFWRQVVTFLPRCCRKDGEDELRYASWLHLGLFLAPFLVARACETWFGMERKERER